MVEVCLGKIYDSGNGFGLSGFPDAEPPLVLRHHDRSVRVVVSEKSGKSEESEAVPQS
jgi:hypothetical protein